MAARGIHAGDGEKQSPAPPAQRARVRGQHRGSGWSACAMLFPCEEPPQTPTAVSCDGSTRSRTYHLSPGPISPWTPGELGHIPASTKLTERYTGGPKSGPPLSPWGGEVEDPSCLFFFHIASVPRFVSSCILFPSFGAVIAKPDLPGTPGRSIFKILS